MIEMDRNDSFGNTGSSSEENDLVGSRKRKLSEPDRVEIEDEENNLVGVTDTGSGAGSTASKGPMDQEEAGCTRGNTSSFVGASVLSHIHICCDACIIFSFSAMCSIFSSFSCSLCSLLVDGFCLQEAD